MNDKNFCGNCGAELKQGDLFCAGCGYSVNEMQTQEINMSKTPNKKQGGIKAALSAVSKKDKLILIAFGAFVVLVAIIGIIVAVCSGSDASELIGTWKDPDDGEVVAIFNDNGIMYWDKHIMRYEVEGNGKIKVNYMMRYDLDDYYIHTNIENFLENYAEDYIEDMVEKYADDNDIEKFKEGETLYYKFVEGEMYDKLYMEDARDELEDRIMDDEYLTRVK